MRSSAGSFPWLAWIAFGLSISLLVGPIFLWWWSIPCVVQPLFTRFKSEPHFKAALIDVTHYTKDRSLLGPGYIFFTAFFRDDTYGPQIFDSNGELIWLGQDIMHGRAQSVHVCDYLGTKGTHICFADHVPHRGTNRIIDNTYKPLRREYHVTNFTADAQLNSHEFNVLEGGSTLLQAVNLPKSADLRHYGGRIDGEVTESCFQELDVESMDELFRWCWLDHFDIEESHPTSKRLTSNETWDALHLNSVDKNFEGDYMVSLRHTDQIIKIAGLNNVHGMTPGSIVWRLGANHSSFKVDRDALFNHQHHARFIETTNSGETITLFNNAFRSRNTATGTISTGMILHLDNETMQAHLVKSYPHPYNGKSPGQGSMQILPNGNAFVGWGGQPEWSEFSQDGTLLSHAFVSVGPINYRTQKMHWEGNPSSSPKLVVYSRRGFLPWAEHTLFAYVSWNGATKVKAWRFHLSDTGLDGPWRSAGTHPKIKFETKIKLPRNIITSSPRSRRFVLVEALDEYGSVLDSTAVKAYGPKNRRTKYCDVHYCRKPNRFRHVRNDLVQETCSQNTGITGVTFAVLVIFIEVLSYAFVYYLDSVVTEPLGV